MSENRAARYALARGEGEGAILGLAAGDAVVSDDDRYTALTQQAVVTAYHLLRHARIDPPLLAAELLELAGDERDPDVYRGASGGFRRWLDSKGGQPAEADLDSCWDPVIRAVPIGLWWRRRPDELIAGASAIARVTHSDPVSAVLAALGAGAVAAGGFGQNGRDFLMALREVAERAGAAFDGSGDIPGRISQAVANWGDDPAELAARMGDDPVGRCLAAFVLAAAASNEPHRSIESAARWGGSPFGALVGAVVGARVGIRVWPWAFPNDTWFAALGRRLVAAETGLVDLPIPYAVEHRVSFALDDRIL